MKSFKRAVYKVGLIDETPQISCNQSLNVDGNEGIYEVEITIGTETGDTGLRYEAFGIPDRFQLFFDGQLVADSKFVGDNLTDYKVDLSTISNKELNVYEYDGSKFINSGRTEIITIGENDIANSSPSELPFGKGQLKFNKNKAEVTVMKLRVIGVLGQTIWNASPVCPNQFPSDSSGGSLPNVRTYDLISFRFIPNMACEDFDQGTIRQYYSTGNLVVGTKLYLDSQLTKLMPSGYAYLGRTIYEVQQGEIVDKYPCHKGTGI